MKCILHFLGLVLVLQYRQRKDFEEGKDNVMCRTTLTFSFFSSLSDGNLWETLSFTEPSLNMSPKPMPLIFFGWAMTPLPWWGDVGLDAPSLLSVNTHFCMSTATTSFTKFWFKKKKKSHVTCKVNCKNIVKIINIWIWSLNWQTQKHKSDPYKLCATCQVF